MCNKITVGPSYHVGHVVLKSMRKNSDLVNQIDVATGKQETTGSVLSRSIKLARCLRKFGLSPGDVVAVTGFNHLDIYIPFFSSLLNGFPVVGVDPNYKYNEIKTVLKITTPKVIFCDEAFYETYVNVVQDLGIAVKIITFGDGKESLATFIESYGDAESEDAFAVSEFDTDKIYCFLITTSGTTGKVKVAAFKHREIMTKMVYPSIAVAETYKSTNTLNLSPVNWVSGCYIALAALVMGQCRVQTSIPDNLDIVIDIINKHKPVLALLSPFMMSSLLKRKQDVDLSCFFVVIVTGSKVYLDVLEEFQKCLRKGAVAMESYGQTETVGPVLEFIPGTPRGSSGKPHPLYSIKLVDPETGKEVTEPNTPGELWAKGPCFTEYLNHPEETKESFSEDGYFKTGDLLYRDEQGFYYFVDRVKTLIKYRNFHVIPAELEEIIHTHEGVSEVCVIGIDHPEDGQRPVACIVRKNGSQVSAEEILQLVSKNVSKQKELHGGVVFLEKLPQTSTGKIARKQLQETVLNCLRNF